MKLRIFLIIIMFFSSCKKSDVVSRGQILKLNIGVDLQTLDPRKARDLPSITVMHMLFEGLTRVSKTGKIELALATSVDIADEGLKYVFHLRDSQWSNGDKVTSFDFAESWKSILDPLFPTDIAYQLFCIKNARKAKMGEISLDQVGIYTPDPHILIVELEKPVPYFLDFLSMPSFFPIPHQTANVNPNWPLAPETFVCNGPFTLQFWSHSDQIRVSKNGKYWQAKDVKLDGIELYMIAKDTELRMFEEGKLDWAGSPLSNIPIDAMDHLRSSNQLHVNPFSATYFYRVNVTDYYLGKKNPLRSSLFRKALAFSLNRKLITDHVLQGGQTPAMALVPPEMKLSDKGYFRDNSKNRAKSLLMDALLELDLTISTIDPIKLSYYNNEQNGSIAQVIQKQWEESLGIKVELDPVEPKVFFQKISNREYQLAAGSWFADFNDPINFLEVFKYKDASTSNTNWECVKYIDLLNASQLCKNSEERRRLLYEAEQILMDQMPIIPVFHYCLNYLQIENLEEVALSPLGQIDFRWASFTPSSKM